MPPAWSASSVAVTAWVSASSSRPSACGDQAARGQAEDGRARFVLAARPVGRRPRGFGGGVVVQIERGVGQDRLQPGLDRRWDGGLAQPVLGVPGGLGVLARVLGRLGQAEQQRRLGLRLQAGPQRLLAQLLRLGDAGGRGEQPDRLGDHRGPGRVVVAQCVQGLQHQLGGGARSGGGDLGRRVAQQADGRRHACPAAEQQVAGDLGGGPLLLAGDRGRLAVLVPGTGGAERAADGLVHQVVPEAHAVGVVGQHPGRGDLVDQVEQPGRLAAHQPGRGLDVERPVQHRRRPQQPLRVGRQDAEDLADRLHEARRQVFADDGGRLVGDHDLAGAGQGGEQLLDPQRVAAAARGQGEHGVVDPGPDDLPAQAGGGVVVEHLEADLGAPLGQPVQRLPAGGVDLLVAAGQQPAHRRGGEGGDELADGEGAQLVHPVRVVDHDQQGPDRRVPLERVPQAVDLGVVVGVGLVRARHPGELVRRRAARAERAGQRHQRGGQVVPECLPRGDRDVPFERVVAGRAEQFRLADAGRSEEDVTSSGAGPGVVQRPADHGELPGTTDDALGHGCTTGGCSSCKPVSLASKKLVPEGLGLGKSLGPRRSS